MSKQIFFFPIFFLIFFILSGCNITYKVRNQSNEFEYILFMPCGKVSFELVGRGNSKFVLRQDFDLDSKIRYMSDSLWISYNGQRVIPDFNGKNVQGSIVEIDNDLVLNASFDLHEGVFDGDMIIVAGRNFMDCNQQMISLDTMEYYFMNSFRIRGVNYPKDDLEQ